MKVKILRNLGAKLILELGDKAKDLTEGKVADLPDDLAKDLIKRGLAEAAKN